jgi:hypothetical protein
VTIPDRSISCKKNAEEYFKWRCIVRVNSAYLSPCIMLYVYVYLQPFFFCVWIITEKQFPMDVAVAERDHPMLDRDALESLFRRLHTLNRCAKIRIDAMPKFQVSWRTHFSLNSYCYQLFVDRFPYYESLNFVENLSARVPHFSEMSCINWLSCSSE